MSIGKDTDFTSTALVIKALKILGIMKADELKKAYYPFHFSELGESMLGREIADSMEPE